MIIPFGINQNYYRQPGHPRRLCDCNHKNPFNIIYLSAVELYKHHVEVVTAISKLRKITGWPLVLNFFGGGSPAALDRLKAAVEEHDSDGSWVNYHGFVPAFDLFNYVRQADVGVFASSCENLPNALLEMMAAGLPIASSHKGPMPEILKDAALYFDPEDSDEIAAEVQKLIENPELRHRLSQRSYSYALSYSWRNCSDETYSFLADICNGYKRGKLLTPANL